MEKSPKSLLNRLSSLSKGKGKWKKGKSIVAFTCLAVGNILAISTATFAWFIAATRNSQLDTVSGDLNVEIKKVTAYKYIYPFYAGSNEFIDYDSPGQVKGYVIEDSEIPQPSVFSDETEMAASLSLSLSDLAGSATDANRGPEKIYAPSPNFRYFLVGDETFTGLEDTSLTPMWSTLTGVSFSSSSDASALAPIELTGVTLSVGSCFTFFDSFSISSTKARYFSFSPLSDTTCFELEDGAIKCKKAGIYSFSYDGTNLSISLSSRPDSSIIGNNLLDPTKITIDHAGLGGGQTLAEYTPTAIRNQNTMVVLDVELQYKNANPIVAGLKLVRNSMALISPAIQPLSKKYSNTTAHLTGYVRGGQRNALLASDFFSFYALFSDESHKFDSVTSLWEGMHQSPDIDLDSDGTPDFCKFDNGAYFDTSKETILHEKSSGVTSIGGNASGSAIYHCYIGIEYDHERASFFMANARIGKTYLLDRDFGFYFYGKQDLGA